MRVFLILLLLPLAGCSNPPSPDPAPADASPHRGVNFFGETPDLADARPEIPLMAHLTVYQLSVPLRTVSANEELWKRVDEQSIDPQTYRRLRANGIRVGLARDDDWDYFRGIFLKNPVVATIANSAAIAQGYVEMPLQSGIDSEDIFFFDTNGDLVGRSYDLCDHFMAITFQALERKPGVVRVEMCPLIRALREQIEVSMYEGERQVKYVRPEHYYDLNLRVDVPLDEFLIVAPAPEARWPSSVGQRFLLQDRRAAIEETVLVLAPKPFRMDQPSTQPATTRSAR